MPPTNALLSDVELLTDSDTIEYPLAPPAEVTLDLSADPLGDPEFTIQATDEDGGKLTVDRVNQSFFADPIRRERAARRIAWTISEETDQGPSPTTVLNVFGTIRADLGADSVIPIDEGIEKAIENVSSVTYTPGKEEPLTVVHGPERYDRTAKSLVKPLTRFGPEQVGEGFDPPTDQPGDELKRLYGGDKPRGVSERDRETSDRWNRFRRLLFAMAEVGEQPNRREPLEITDPSVINRLPRQILGGIEGEELVKIIKESETLTGHPERSVRGRVIERGGTRPSLSVLRKFVREWGLADQLEDFTP
jgi:hypothetical protein